MKTRRWTLAALTVLLILGAAVAALGPGSFAWAAPWAKPEQAPVPGSAMPALPEAVCTLDAVTLTRTCDVWALPGSLTMPDGVSVNVWGFATSAAGPASVPGPVIRANVGETVVVNLHNEIPDQAVSLGFPSMDGAPDMAGAPTGANATYTLDPVTEPGAFMYEAGLTPDGARQVAMGLFGALIFTDPAVTPTWNVEALLFFSAIDPSFNADPLNFSMARFQPRYWLINGKAFPDNGWIPVAAGEQVLLRYFNAGVEHLAIGLLGIDQYIQAADGHALPFPRGAGVESIAPGQTRDSLVTIPAGAVQDTAYPLYHASLIQHNNNQRLPNMRTAFGGMLTFLNVTTGGAGGGVGPTASSVALTPQKTNGSVDVTLSASLTDDVSNVIAAEYFIDTLGTPGSGAAIPVVVPAQTVSISAVIDVATLSALASGDHTLYVRGQDDAGNWGSPGSTVLTLDKAGPAILGLALSPNPTNGTVNLTLGGTADDTANGNSIVVAAEYTLDGGAAVPMTLNPTGAAVSGISATIPASVVSALAEGIHSVDVRALDEWGNWTAVPAHVDLRIDKTGPVVPVVTLSASVIDLSKPIPTSVRLTATIEDQLSGVGGVVQSNVVAVEGFIDVAGTSGSGFALYPSDGLFNETLEDAYYNIPGAHLASLSPGSHQVLVHGKDAAGNWGAFGSATIEIVTAVPDTTGPVVSNVVAVPNPTGGSGTVVLTATATDTQSNIAGVVWFQGTTPPRKITVNMLPVDGTYDELVEDVTATINVSKWKVGVYQISVRAFDKAGNWGAIVTITLEVTR